MSTSSLYAPRCIYVCGPPGSGKSYAVRQYLQQHEVPHRYDRTAHNGETDVVIEDASTLSDVYPLVQTIAHPSIERVWCITNIVPDHVKERDWNTRGNIKDKVTFQTAGQVPWDMHVRPQDAFPLFRLEKDNVKKV